MKLKSPLDFTLPDSSLATKPAELRGAGRDDIRLMVTRRASGSVEHDVFDHLDRFLETGDVLVVNTSATMPAAVEAATGDDTRLKVHFAGPASGGLWAIEVRGMAEDGGTTPGPDLRPQTLYLPDDVKVHLLAKDPRTPRLWISAVEGCEDLNSFLAAHGEPIRYVPGPRMSLDSYQTVFSVTPGSAEMPSAGRPFTTSTVTRLITRGVAMVPILLHSGVSSYEEGETPGEERYEVSATTAAMINTLAGLGGRVIAVGTTVVRALETVTDTNGVVHPGAGTTQLVIGPERGPRVIDGLLTGWHEPRSSHLMLLEAFLGRDLLEDIYGEAVVSGYLWHEFGDELLILP
ncbi:MAG: S-adenosylmethionine:tRNA ribosyltransferase-isomerase [Actinomycetota bacterium]